MDTLGFNVNTRSGCRRRLMKFAIFACVETLNKAQTKLQLENVKVMLLSVLVQPRQSILMLIFLQTVFQLHTQLYLLEELITARRHWVTERNTTASIDKTIDFYQRSTNFIGGSIFPSLDSSEKVSRDLLKTKLHLPKKNLTDLAPCFPPPAKVLGFILLLKTEATFHLPHVWKETKDWFPSHTLARRAKEVATGLSFRRSDRLEALFFFEKTVVNWFYYVWETTITHRYIIINIYICKYILQLSCVYCFL